MVTKQKSIVNISVNQKIGLLVPYIKKRIMAQIQAVALIVIYLICFQTIVLNTAISEAAIVATGITVVVIGLALFMEGLFCNYPKLVDTSKSLLYKGELEVPHVKQKASNLHTRVQS